MVSEGSTYRAQPDAGVLEFLVLGTIPPNDTTRLVAGLLAFAASMALVAWDVRFSFALLGTVLAPIYALIVGARIVRRWTRRVHFVATSEGLLVDAGPLENPIELSASEASRLRLEERHDARQRRSPIGAWWLITEGELGERVEVTPLYDEASARWALDALREFFTRHEVPSATAISPQIRALGPRPSRIAITEPHDDLDRQCGCSNTWEISIRWSITRRVVASTAILMALLVVGGLGMLVVRHPFLLALHLCAAIVGLIGTVSSLRDLEMARRGTTKLRLSDQGVQWWTGPFRMSWQPAWPEALRFTRARVRTAPTGDQSQVVITQADGVSHTFEPKLKLTQAEADYLARAIEALQKEEAST